MHIVAALLERVKGRPPVMAMRIAREVIRSGKLSELGQPIIDDTIRNCREDIGVACFGTAPDNPILWTRYAGGGSGVCVEIDVPDDLIGTQLHRVEYNDSRTIHIDDFILASNDLRFAALHYVTLLSKSLYWKPEGEVRFLSKRQQIEVVIDGSQVTRVYLGPSVEPRSASQVRSFAARAPVSVLATTP